MCKFRIWFQLGITSTILYRFSPNFACGSEMCKFQFWLVHWIDPRGFNRTQLYLFLTFFSSQIDLIILNFKTDDGQFTLTTKKSLHITFKAFCCSWPLGCFSLILKLYVMPCYFAMEIGTLQQTSAVFLTITKAVNCMDLVTEMTHYV